MVVCQWFYARERKKILTHEFNYSIAKLDLFSMDVVSLNEARIIHVVAIKSDKLPSSQKLKPLEISEFLIVEL